MIWFCRYRTDSGMNEFMDDFMSRGLQVYYGLIGKAVLETRKEPV
jgi:hypothetical protein